MKEVARIIKKTRIKKTRELNPFLVATITALLYFVVFTLVKYAVSKEFDWVTVIAGTIVIWIVYLFLQSLINRIIRKRLAALKKGEL